MSASNIFDVAAAIVTVALVTAVVSNRNSADVIQAFGSAFSNSISAALGR